MIHSRQIKKQRQTASSFPWKAASVFLSVSCVVFGVIYLVGMNDLIVKGFALKDLKSQVNMLAQENQDLQAKALTLQSYAVLSPRLQGLNMVQVEDVAYFIPQTPIVAKK